MKVGKGPVGKMYEDQSLGLFSPVQTRLRGGFMVAYSQHMTILVTAEGPEGTARNQHQGRVKLSVR